MSIDKNASVAGLGNRLGKATRQGAAGTRSGPPAALPPARLQATPSATPAGPPAIERPRQSPDAGLAASARQMLDAAERLFAERGIDNVSLREIGAAAGQRNLSAAQYHFGSRETLVGLLVGRRVWLINERRHARFDVLEAAGQADTPNAVVNETLRTLTDVVRDEPWGADYIRVAAQVVFRPELDGVMDRDRVYWSGHDRVNRLLRQRLPELPEQVFRDRCRILRDEIVYSIARWIKVHGPVTAATRERYEALVRHTVEFLAAGLCAPHTAHPAAPPPGPGDTPGSPVPRAPPPLKPARRRRAEPKTP